MKRIDKAKVKTVIGIVEEYGKSREFEDVTVEEVNFYTNAFYELVKIIEEATGENLCDKP